MKKRVWAFFDFSFFLFNPRKDVNTYFSVRYSLVRLSFFFFFFAFCFLINDDPGWHQRLGRTVCSRFSIPQVLILDTAVIEYSTETVKVTSHSYWNTFESLMRCGSLSLLAIEDVSHEDSSCLGDFDCCSKSCKYCFLMLFFFFFCQIKFRSE